MVSIATIMTLASLATMVHFPISSGFDILKSINPNWNLSIFKNPQLLHLAFQDLLKEPSVLNDVDSSAFVYLWMVQEWSYPDAVELFYLFDKGFRFDAKKRFWSMVEACLTMKRRAHFLF